MGNGKDEDYNFVFKGKLGLLETEESREGGREAIFREDRVLSCFFISYLDSPPPPGSAFLLGEKGGLKECRQVWLQVQMFRSCMLYSFLLPH